LKCARRWRPSWCNCATFDEAIARLDRIIAKLAQKEETARRLMSIPGFGPITASAMAATIQDTSSFAGYAANIEAKPVPPKIRQPHRRALSRLASKGALAVLDRFANPLTLLKRASVKG
jgi:transposase